MSLPLFLKDFYCYQIKVRFQASIRVEMKQRWYFLPRYALGNALKKSTNYSYLYNILFKPDPLQTEGLFTPLIIRADKPTRRFFQKKEFLDLYITLIPSSESVLVDFLTFLHEWEYYNFFAENKFLYVGYQLLDRSLNRFDGATTYQNARLDYNFFSKIKPVWDESLEIEFTTPTSLKINGELQKDIPYHKIINRISEKCYHLFYDYLEPERKNENDKYLTEVRGTTLLSRVSLPKQPTVKKNKQYNLAGIVGKIYYDVPFSETDAVLLAVGSVIHIGNHTVAGNGQIKAKGLKSHLFKQYIDALVDHRSEVAGIEAHEQDTAISAIARQEFCPRPYRRILVPKSNGEFREIILSDPLDNFLQKTLAEILAKNIDNELEYQSYAYRKGKSAIRAIQKIKEWRKQAKENQYVIRCDINHFFDEISHSILRDFILCYTEDPFITGFTMLWVKNPVIDPAGELKENSIGIPQGSPVSPILANLYLDAFDEYVAQHITRDFIRYADDIFLLVPDRQSAIIILQRISDYLKNNLNLSLNNEFLVTPIHEPFTFLGIQFFSDHLEMAPNKKQKLLNKIKKSILADTESFSGIKKKIEGYKRYYGRLLNREELAEIDQIIFKAYTAFLLKDPQFSKQIEGVGGIVSRYDFNMQVRTLPKSSEKKGARKSTDSPLQKQKKKHWKKLVASGELVVLKKGAYIGITKNYIRVTAAGETIDKQKLALTNQITIMSEGVSLSSNLITGALKKHIPISFFGKTGEIIGTIEKPGHLLPENIRKQLELPENKKKIFAILLVKNKLSNQQKLIRYFLKYRKKDKDLSEALNKSDHQIAILKGEITTDKNYEDTKELLFLTEARAAIHYWEAFRLLVQNYGIPFESRVKKGAPDLVNQMLNYGYAILQSKIIKSIHHARLSPNVSYLHSRQANKPTLCFDLMEQYRSFVVDRSIIALLAKKEKVGQDKSGFLDLETRKRIISKINEKLYAPEKKGGDIIHLSDHIFNLTRDLLNFIEGKQAKPQFYNPKW